MACAQTNRPSGGILPEPVTLRSRVVIVHDAQATEAFKPRPDRIRAMVDRAITNLTIKSTPAAAWRGLVSTNDVVGLKVYSAPGPMAGTRPGVVSAVIEGLLAAGLPTNRIVIWDKHRADLRRAGFFEVAARYHVRVEGATSAGYDESTFYEPGRPVPGPLVWSDLEYGRESATAGRRSHVSKLLTRDITKIINITPLLNHNVAGVAGNLYSLAMGSMDNTLRFEMEAGRLAEAVPEVYALPALGDRVALNVVDALVCQYEGQEVSMLHYSAVLNELRFSLDPVALDVLSLEELERRRKLSGGTPQPAGLQLYRNAAELELGTASPASILVERFL